MRSLVAAAAVLWLGGGLSCTHWSPVPEPVPAPPEATTSPPQIPTPPARVASRFARFQTGLAPFEIREVSRVIVEESRRNGFDWELILAVIETEGSFNNFARSNVGALGLMQIMPATGRMLADELGIAWSGAETLFDPVVNVRLGTRYLAVLHAKYETWDAALAAYNWGPGAIDRRLRNGRDLPSLYARAVYARVGQQTGL